MNRELLPRHRELLHARAIADDVIAERGYFTVERPKDLQLLGFGPSLQHAPTLVLPIHGVNGGAPWYQHRPDLPPIGSNGHPRKYLNPARREMGLDVPPRARAYMRDGEPALLITEGIPKADALVSAGARAAVGLIGVWNWRGTNELGGKTVLPAWDEIALDGRQVFVCFDSDARLNPHVCAAMERLGGFLSQRDARVGYIYLPAAGGGDKQGVDDYLAAGRTLADVVELAEPDVRRAPSQRKPAKPAREFEPYSLAGCEAVFREELHLPDTTALRLVLAAVAVNRLRDRPLWLLLVGVPSSGKTEIIWSISPLPEVHPAATLTPAALLSGTSEKERARGATGGLLRELGDYGVLLFKDFTSVLEQRHETRAEALSALREVYDGSWHRPLGTDGGRVLEWRGHAGFIAGVTQAIDSHNAVMGVMGDRFVLLRMPELDSRSQAAVAMRMQGRGAEVRERLAAAACGVLAGIPDDRRPRAPAEAEIELLIRLADMATHARSAVVRERGGGEITLLPEREMPARFALALRSVLDGLDLIGCERREAWRAVFRVAFETVPRLRQRVLDRLYESEGPLPTHAAVEELPTGSGRRALEDLAALKLVEIDKRGSGNKPHTWRLRAGVRGNMRAIRSAEDCLPPNSPPWRDRCADPPKPRRKRLYRERE